MCTHLTQCAFLNWREEEEEEEEEGGLEWTLYGASVWGRVERSTGGRHSLGERESNRIVAECMSASQWEAAAAAADQKVLTICWGSRHALARARSCGETCMRFRGCWHDDKLHFFYAKNRKFPNVFRRHSAKIRKIK